MKIVKIGPIFKNVNGRVVRPIREDEKIILCRTRPSWCSLAHEVRADDDFLTDREGVLSDKGRLKL